MLIQDAQREVRQVYLGGMVGQAVSGAIWLVSAAVATWGSPQTGFWVLILGGVLIFPLTQLALRLLGRGASLSRGNPLNGLAMQVAFTVPLAIPVILAAAGFREGWFYPAFMIIVGAHYLPFIFLYGMRQFAVLAAALLGAGAALGMGLQGQVPLTTGAWFTAAALLTFALYAAAAKPYRA